MSSHTHTYYFKASSIGSGLGNSGYFVYRDSCATGELVAQITKDELLNGFSLTLPTSVEKIYLVPILDDPLANSCVLGCGYAWSELILSAFVPTNSPTPTPTITPTPAITLTPTPTITPSSTISLNYWYGLYPHTMTGFSATNILRITITGPSYNRVAAANHIANTIANTNVPYSDSETVNVNKVTIINQSNVYREDGSYITTIRQAGGSTSKVWWWNESSGTSAFVQFDNQLVAGNENFPTTPSNLKYLII